MAILKIARLGHPVLQKTCDPVQEPVSVDIIKLAADMQETLETVGGTGLAAPQVHNPVRMVVFHMPADRIPPGAPVKPMDYTVMCNPVITPLDYDKTMVWERCLSIPGLHGKVPRYRHIKVEYHGLDGSLEVIEARHVLACLLQHECDHLDGIVYPMRMNDMSYLAFNTDPGRLAQEVSNGDEIDPVFLKLAADWPEKDKWTD